jgi:hypothetical protein
MIDLAPGRRGLSRAHSKPTCGAARHGPVLQPWMVMRRRRAGGDHHRGSFSRRRCAPSAWELVATAQVGSFRIRHDQQLLFGFLHETGLRF